MYELKLSKPPYYRVKRGQTEEQVGGAFGCPVLGEVSCGNVVKLAQGQYTVYSARVGDSFSTIARAFGADEAELERLNGGGAVYPTRTLFVPCKNYPPQNI